MIVAIFRSRIRPEAMSDYTACTAAMRELATKMPGFISVKAYYAEDGEKVAVHQWESAEHLRAWMEHPEHLEAQRRGRQEFYEDFTVFILDEPQVKQFARSV